MTNAVQLGKPEAGNPHIGFDEGEVALAATPRRGSLLYIRKSFDGNPCASNAHLPADASATKRSGFLLHMRPLMATVAFTSAMCYVFADDPVTASATDTIAVDMRTDECRAVGQVDIGYSPKWSGVTDAGSYVVLQKVAGGVTNTVGTFAADAESSYPYTPSSEDSSCVKFIHRVYSSGGVEIGEPLVGEIVFGCRSLEGTVFVVDSRTNSLQEAVAAGNPVNLAYSTAWAADAASVSIKSVHLSGQGGMPVATNAIFSSAADVEGETPMRNVGSGWWRLLCQITDASDNVLLEYLTDEFKIKGGFTLTLR